PAARQDTLGARMQDALGPGGERLLDDVDRPDKVHLPEVPAAVGPQLRVSRQVIDGPTAADGAADRRSVADVRGDELDPIRAGSVSDGLATIEHADPLTPSDQKPDQVAADEAGTAG